MSVSRLYSRLEIKSVNPEKWEFSGVATTPSADRDLDVIDPKGAHITLPVPLLWQHMPDKPVGHVIRASAGTAGIEVDGTITKPTDDMPDSMRERLSEAWASVKSGLVRGLSIGFLPGEFSPIKSGGMHHTSWELLELSLVTIPANVEASITAIKAAAGHAPIYTHPARLPGGAYILRT